MASPEGKFRPVETLVDMTGIGLPAIAMSLCDPLSVTGVSLAYHGLSDIEFAGSITWGQGNFYTTYDKFSEIMAATQTSSLIRQIQSKEEIALPEDINSSLKFVRMLGRLDKSNWGVEAQAFEQFLDFMSGKNADILLTLPPNTSIEIIYDLLCQTLPQDIVKGSFIISLAKHADRLPVIQICSTDDKYTQGYNIIIKSKDDEWNKRASGRAKEVVPVLIVDQLPRIYTTQEIGNNTPSTLIKTPESLGQFLAIFSQELRRTILRPDRGIDLASFKSHLHLIQNFNISHEDACLVMGNLVRSLATNPEKVDEAIQYLGIEHLFDQNNQDDIESCLNSALSQYFVNPARVSPELVKWIATSMPMSLKKFLALKPTTHPVIKSKLITVST